MSSHSLKKQASDDERAAIISKAICRAADSWEINNQELGKILGLSSSSVSRLRNNQFFISKGTKGWELALLFLRAYRGLDAYMGGHLENERAWLAARNTALNGMPIDLIQTVEGLAGVVQYIDCVRGR
jgi:hypothetical protein